MLTVVVTVVDGGDALRRCLTGLLAQADAPHMEVLVPIDSTTAAESAVVAGMANSGGHVVRCVELGQLLTSNPPSSTAGQHELIDRRRAAGLAAAHGEVVAIVEDRAVPKPDWAATAVRLHRQLPHLVIGGAVENGRQGLLESAVYFCDFGRYQRPFDPGPRHYVSDVNVVYKRRALELTRDIWRTRYHEPLVHWALERAGETLFLSPELVVEEHRDHLTSMGLLVERFAWGRLFGSLRVRDASAVRRLALAARSPLIPMVLFGRFLRDRVTKGARVGSILRVAPAVGLLVASWAAGEAAGYLTARSGRPDRSASGR